MRENPHEETLAIRMPTQNYLYNQKLNKMPAKDKSAAL